MCRGTSWYRHDLQAWASALLIFKTLGFGILLNAYSSNTAWSQVLSDMSSSVELDAPSCRRTVMRLLNFVARLLQGWLSWSAQPS